MPPLTAVKGLIQNHRVANALFSATRGFIISAARTFYALWLQATGLIFGVFTVVGGSALLKQYRADHFADHRRLLVVIGFTGLCGWFTVVSFVRAARTRR